VETTTETTVPAILPQIIPTEAEDVAYACLEQDTLNKTTDISPCVRWVQQKILAFHNMKNKRHNVTKVTMCREAPAKKKEVNKIIADTRKLITGLLESRWMLSFDRL
jgi:hypothetical protein